MGKAVREKKELDYKLKIVITLYSMLLYLFIPVLIEKISGVSLTRVQSTTVSLIFAVILFLWFIPAIIGVPKRDSLKTNLQAIGLRIPKKAGIHVFLGVILACCTLGGMLLGSMMIGGYQFLAENISFEQIYFSVLPGIFEEIIFRGIIMAIFMMVYKDLKKVVLLQCLVFTIMHIGGFEINIAKLVDLLGVFALSLGFTYVVIKTKSLLAGMIFHFLHDAFLFVVQLDQEIVFNGKEMAIFYGSLFIAIAIAVIVTKVVSEKFKLGSEAHPLWI